MTLRGLKRAAAYAEVSEGTIRKWIGQGLHHQMAGNVLIVTTEAIDAWKRGETPRSERAQFVAILRGIRAQVDGLISEYEREG
jgi:hypothetical protein